MLSAWFTSNLAPTAVETSLYFIAGKATSSTAGPLVGFAQDMRYGAPDMGVLSRNLFRDIRDPANPKIIRLAGVVNQGSRHIVLAWQEMPGVPTGDMPIFTWVLNLSGTIYNFQGRPRAGTAAGIIGYYITINPGITDGVKYEFNFQ